MLCCLTVKEVQQCYVTAEIHQQCYQKMKSFSAWLYEQTESCRHLMFPDSLFLWLKLWNILTQLSASYIFLGRGGIERMLKMTSYDLVFLERRHAQCGVIMVSDSEAFVEMWVEEADMRTSSAYSVQRKYHNHLSHSEYCIPHFHRTGNSTPEI